MELHLAHYLGTIVKNEPKIREDFKKNHDLTAFYYENCPMTAGDT